MTNRRGSSIQRFRKIAVEGRAVPSSGFFARRRCCSVSHGIQEKFNLPTLCYCGPNGNTASQQQVICLSFSVIVEAKTRFQRPETWVFQLHLKDGRSFLKPETRKRNLLAACLRFSFHSGFFDGELSLRFAWG